MRTKKHRHRGRRGPCFCRRHKHLRGGGIADWWSSVTDKTKSWWQGLGTGCPACDTEKAAAEAAPAAPEPQPEAAPAPPPMQNPFDVAPPATAPAQPPMQNPFDNMMPAAPAPAPLPFEPPQQDMPQAPPMMGGRRRRRRRTRKQRRSRSRSRARHRRTKKHYHRRRRYCGGQGDFLTHDEKGSLAAYASNYMGAPTAQPQVWTA